MAKIVGSCIYVHKSNTNDLLNRLRDNIKADVICAIYEADEQVNGEKRFNYDVIKYDKKEHYITFIESSDWDNSNEPKVGDGWMLKMHQDWTWKFIPKRKKNPQIYHSKELFVSDDYKGFDIEKAKERTKLWKSLPNLDTKRIGNYDFWVEFLNANGMEV